MRITTTLGGALALLVAATTVFAQTPAPTAPPAAPPAQQSTPGVQPPAPGAQPPAPGSQQPGPWHGRHRHGQMMMRGERPLITLALAHKDELGLSPDQVQSLEKLRSDFQTEATRRAQELRTAGQELHQLLSTEPVDMSKVEAKVRDIQRMRGDLQIARIKAIEQGKAQLTPEQRTKLQALAAQPPAGRRGRTGFVAPKAAPRS